MFFKLVFRNLLKRKVFSFINISGLAIGLASSLLIFLYVLHEKNYDNFYPDSDRLYRIVREHGAQGEKEGVAQINYAVADLMRDNLTSIEGVSRFGAPSEVRIKVEEDIYNETDVLYADSEFVEMFGIEFVQGNPENALKEPFSIVLTTDAAKKLFSEEQTAIGKTVTIVNATYSVTGVVNKMPSNAHFNFNYLISLESTKSFYSESMFTHWGNVWCYTYVKLKEGVNKSQFEDQLTAIIAANGPDVLDDFGVRFYSQKVSDIHLESNLGGELEKNGDGEVLNILIGVVILILSIACFNFINLTTARATWRAKEVGVKKVMGIHKSSLILQFLGESLFVVFLALIGSFVLIGLFLPVFNSVTGKAFSLIDILLNMPLFLLLAILVGLLAGSIPALMLSGFDPISSLKGKGSQIQSRTAVILRQFLVVIQFSIAILLIMGAIVLNAQTDFILSKDLGMTIDNVMAIEIKSKHAQQNIQPLLNELEKNPDIEMVAAGSDLPFEELNSWRVKPTGDDATEQLIDVISIDENYIHLLNIQSGLNSTDAAEKNIRPNTIIVNEAFVRNFLLTNPVGSKIVIDQFDEPVEVVGVVEDYHYSSLHDQIRPLMLYQLPSWYFRVLVKTKRDPSIVMAEIEPVFNSINPDDTFDYFFLESSFEQLHQSEMQTAELVSYFSLLAIVIACLGLYGLAAYVAESKLKEISVRKVLGSSVNALFAIQFKLFIQLLVVSSIISIPIAYWLLNKWLASFAFRIELSWWYGLIAIVTIMTFTLLSAGYRLVRSAMVNPVDNLRME